MAKKRLPEFPTDWHQDAYEEGLGRELAGYRRRIAELRAIGVRDEEGSLRDALSGEQAVLAELRRLGHGQKAAAKRPRKVAEKRRTRSSGKARTVAESERPGAASSKKPGK